MGFSLALLAVIGYKGGMYAMATSNPPRWAQAIRARREALGRSEGDKVTQEEIAARTGDVVSQRTISHLEKGSIEISGLAYSRVVALAKALNWSLPEFARATGLDPDGLDEAAPAPAREIELPDALREAIDLYGDRYPDLHNPRWQRYLTQIRWRQGRPSDPERWFDAYRDLVRNGIEPGDA